MSSSASTPNPWSPYDTYKDCSQGICSIYCPQWCYLIFPPPPPLGIDDDDDDSSTDFSPLIIALIGILASAFILVSYYTIISKYCKRRRGQQDHTASLDQFNGSRDHEMNHHDGWQGGNSEGLDEGLINSITVCKYKKGDGLLVEGYSDCSVCLSEFQEDESLRLLPKCNHAFHVPCIDTWLKSHSSCPLCRANIAPTTSSAAVTVLEVPRSVSVSAAFEYQQRNDAISVVQDLEEEDVVSLVVCDDAADDNIMGNVQESSSSSSRMIETRQEGDGIQPLMRRSVSMSSCLFQGQVLSIADILRISEEDEDHLQSSMGIGSSKQIVDGGEYYCKSNYRNGVFNLVRNPLTMKRSISTGRFMFPRYEKERNPILPN